MDDDNAIVIVGVGCKFPGADDLDEFWRVLSEGENHVIEIPRERWNNNAFYHQDPNEPGKTYVTRAGLIKKYDEWDNKLFNINEMEAAWVDPQQRYVLDCVHMAMEDGGITRKDLYGSNTGVYIGVMNDDYKGSSSDDLNTMTNYSLTGTSPSIISARVSYTYNLLGPSMSIDTACSSALVAIHTASQALKSGDCDVAICGGVNSILYPDIFVPLSKARMVSPTGQCQAFSDKADGYARGEGCGIVILKTKKQAMNDGNKIWAAIATGCNQDGRTTTPITAPSSIQQRNLLVKVYSETGIDPKDIQYIEAHGTGTPVGDPIETNTLGGFFAEKIQNGESRQNNVLLGSVKTNIGHLESAAGAAGLIKVLLMMQNGKIVPSLHYDNGNPNINFDEFRLEVARNMSPWPCLKGGGRLSCVNSFGFGGTNSHAVIKQLPECDLKEDKKARKSKHIIAVTGSDLKSLGKNFTHLKQSIHKDKYCLEDISYTSTCRRDHYAYRAAFLVETKEDVVRKCNEHLHQLQTIKPQGFSKPNVVFVFCGVGTTWTGMCQELLNREEKFIEIVREIDRLLAPLAGWSILQTLTDGFDITDPLKSHLAIFTCQVALAKLWNHLGIQPDIIVGQSVGEVAAAYAAGVLSIEGAVRVIYERSRILVKAIGGTMCVIGNCNVSIVGDTCTKCKGKVNIAVHSSPKACTLTGDRDAIEETIQFLEKENKDKSFIRRLNVQCAYHSHYTETASEELETALCGLKGMKPQCKLISTVTGEYSTENDFVTPQYWAKNVRQPVLFQHAITKAQSEKTFNIYLEIGPKPVLRFHLGDIVGTDNATALPSMTEKKELDTVQLSFVELFKHGIDPCWPNIVTTASLTDLPKCSFNPVKQLFKSDVTLLKYSGVQKTQSSHLFVERAGGDEILFKINISPTSTWFLYEHVVSGTIMVPGAFYIDVALEIAKELGIKSKKNINISAQFVNPLRLNRAEPCRAEAYVDKMDEDVSIHILKNKETSARCHIRWSSGPSLLETVDVEAIRRRCTVCQSATKTYQNLKALGFSYGSELKILGDAFKSDDECLVKMTLTDGILKDIDATHMHPAILDGLLQTPGVLNVNTNKGTTLLPGGIESIMIRQSPERKMLAFASLVSQTKHKIRYNALLLTEDGRVIAEIRNFFILCIGSNYSDEEDCMYQIRWEEKEKKEALAESRNLSKEQHNSVVISIDKNDAEIIDSEVNKMSVKHLSSQDEFFEGKLKNHLQMPVVIQSLIYAVDKQESLDQLTGEEVMKKVLANACVLLKICQQLVDMRIDLPVLIITDKTQGIDVSKNQVENVIGSELWGMARSIVLEYPLQLTLIDRHVPLRKCSSIIKDLLIHRNPQLCSETELMITENKVYFNRLVPQQELPREYKWISIEKSDRVHLKSRRPDNVEDKFCLLQDTESIPKGMFMEVEQAVMHDSALFSLTTQSAENDIPIWASDKEDGFDILTFEICGKVTVHSDEKLPNQLEGMYAACSQFTLQSIVETHKNCIMRIDDLPNYKPGTLRASAFLWHMKEYLVRGRTLIITNGDDTLGQILRAMLSKPMASQVVIESLGDFQNSVNQQYTVETVVILTAVTLTTLDNILEKIEGVHTCLSWEMFVPMRALQTTRIKYGELSFIILNTDEILARKNMLQTIPKAAKWLRKNLFRIQCDKRVDDTISVVKLDSVKLQKKLVKVRKGQLFRRKSCYVIVGGLTGLGWEIVKYLATAYSANIVTLSRSKPNAAQTREISRLEKMTSTSITALSADITSIRSLEKAFSKIENEYGHHSVKGIFHGGAVLNDGFFTKQTNDSFKKVLLPKVLGSWNLHTISKRYDLDFFILHSSMTSVFGNKGQSNYSAGNAFMDSLAHFRAANDYPGLSINWGPLAVGMAADNALQKELERIGYMFLDVRMIIESLVKTLMSDGNQIVVGIFDWSLVESQFTDVSVERVRRRFRRMMGNDKRNVQAISAELVGNHDLNTTEGITSFVIDVASRVFAVDVDMISISTSLTNLGIDSMVAMTFVNTINGATNCTIPIVLLLSEETTMEKIVDYLEANIKRATHMTSCQKDVTQSDDLTHMEREYFKFIAENIDAPHLFTYVDFEASGYFANEDLWKAHLGHVVMKHAALRTHFVQRTDSYGNSTYTRVVTPAEETEIDFQVVEKGSINRKERIPSDMTMYRFFPETDFPLRLLYEVTDETCFVRMVFSHLTFDMTSIMLVLEDIQNYKTDADAQVLESVTQYIARHVNERLHEQENALEEYWRGRIPAILSPLSMAGTERELPKELDISTITAQIPQQLVVNLAQFCRNNAITRFQLMVTAYQILLHVVTRMQTVCLLTLADMRMIFPQFQREIGCMVNKVPLFLTFSEERTINNLLIENGKDIRMMLNSGLYPFRQIVNEVTARHVDPDAVFRHMLVYRDFQNANTDEKDGYVKLLNAVSPNHMHETVMVVWNDRINKAMNLELEHNTLIISKPEAESILQLLIRVLEYLIDHGDSTMHDMTREFNHAALLIHPVGSEINRTSEISIASGEFLKQTRNGWNHQVQLSVCRDQDGDQVLVKWRRTKNHRSREIYGKDIESVDRGTCNGLHALTVSTKERNERVYTFMTPNKQLCDTITSCLLDRLEGARTKGQNTKL